MTGNKNGLIDLLKSSGVAAPSYYCIIHQYALSAQSNALNHRIFKIFFNEFGADHNDLLLYNDIRWLSAGKSLMRLFQLQNEV